MTTDVEDSVRMKTCLVSLGQSVLREMQAEARISACDEPNASGRYVKLSEVENWHTQNWKATMFYTIGLELSQIGAHPQSPESGIAKGGARRLISQSQESNSVTRAPDVA